jgi:hypothetical protein
MRIVFFTRTGFQQDPLFLYIYAHVAQRWPDHAIVACQPVRRGLGARLRKISRLGFWKSLEIISSTPISRSLRRRDSSRLRSILSDLARPDIDPRNAPLTLVHSINGPDAVDAITKAASDILLQSGAGVLKKQIFSIPKITTLNMHHGIAPLIKGMDSIYWGLFSRRPEWIGSTVHEIDEGIDTGSPLGYAPVAPRDGEGFPELFARATKEGVAVLLNTLERLEKGERWRAPIPTGHHVYRSTFSGWKMLALRLRSK